MRNIFSVALALVCTAASSQSFLDIQDKQGRSVFEDNWFNLMARYTYVGGKDNYTIGGFTGNVSLRKAKVGKGEFGAYYENPTLGDLIWTVANFKKSDKIDQAFGSGLLGWVQVYYNVVSQDKLIIAPGVSLGDYIYGSEVATTRGNITSNEPFGYYLAMGPSGRISYLVNKDFWIDGVLTWDLALTKFKKGYGGNYIAEKGYPNPWFINATATIYHKSKLFLSARVNQGVDRGGNKGNATRLDVSLGYQFLH